MWVAIHTSTHLLKHSLRQLRELFSALLIPTTHVLWPIKTKCADLISFSFLLPFWNLRSQIFDFASAGMKAKISLSSFNENCDFHTVLPPLGTTLLWSSLWTRRVAQQSRPPCAPQPELNPDHYAEPGLCWIQGKTFLLLTSFAATVTSAAANITCMKGWCFSNPAESSKNFHWWTLQVCYTLLIHGSLYLL